MYLEELAVIKMMLLIFILWMIYRMPPIEYLPQLTFIKTMENLPPFIQSLKDQNKLNLVLEEKLDTSFLVGISYLASNLLLLLGLAVLKMKI